MKAESVSKIKYLKLWDILRQEMKSLNKIHTILGITLCFQKKPHPFKCGSVVD